MPLAYSQAFVVLATDDLDRLVNFYSQLLAQSPLNYRQGVYAEFKLDSLRLGMFQPSINGSEFDDIKGSRMSICLEVEDIQKALAQLTELNCPPPGTVQTASHGQEIYAFDPDGNRLIIHQAWR